MAEVELIGIPAAELAIEWPHVRDLLMPAIRLTSGRMSEATVFDAITNRDMQLWEVWDDQELVAAVVTELREYPTGMRTCNIVLTGGKNHQDWVDLIVEIEAWARTKDCKIIEIINGRPGWGRSLPYRKSRVTLEKDLSDA